MMEVMNCGKNNMKSSAGTMAGSQMLASMRTVFWQVGWLGRSSGRWVWLVGLVVGDVDSLNMTQRVIDRELQ